MKFNIDFVRSQFPAKFQPGNVNYELCYGLTGIKDYFIQLAEANEGPVVEGFRASLVSAFDAIAGYEETISARLLDYLNSKPNLRIIGRTEADQRLRVPTVSFVVDNVKSSTIPPQVDPHHIGIRYGDFYARRLIQDLGLAPQDGVIRVSPVHYNTIEEIDKLIHIFERLF